MDMAKNPNQKLKILYIMRMLMRETDEAHGLTMADIIDRLDEHGIKAERKSIYDDIALLCDFGLDIIKRKTSSTEYYIGSRDFEHTELTLLIDAVQSSKFLTEKKSAGLIRKLGALTSVHEATKHDKQVYVAGRVKMQNESIFYNVDAIQRALSSKRKISVLYYDYDLSKKKIVRKDGGRYTVNPVGLTYIDEYYYLVTYSEEHGDFANYRADRMMGIDVLDEPAARIPKTMHFNISEYCRHSFSMFSGEDVHVQLVFHKSLMNAIIDRFGKDVQVEKIDDDFGRAHVVVSTSGPFFGWLTQFGNQIAIDAPDDLRDEYAEFLENILEQYYCSDS
jgi:predicted DNA-binding transcriptional regulator YafY